MKKGKDYTISKIKAVKGVGNAKSVKIKGKGKYKGSFVIRYGILPETKMDIYITQHKPTWAWETPYVKLDVYWKTTKESKIIELFVNTTYQLNNADYWISRDIDPQKKEEHCKNSKKIQRVLPYYI